MAEFAWVAGYILRGYAHLRSEFVDVMSFCLLSMCLSVSRVTGLTGSVAPPQPPLLSSFVCSSVRKYFPKLRQLVSAFWSRLLDFVVVIVVVHVLAVVHPGILSCQMSYVDYSAPRN